ncbi:MAG: hypothetical protein HFF48_05405 [Lawsonibacter sp.]|nr:hypothetical protein [Lawsonibacter sp.]
MYIQISDTVWTATLEDNPSVTAWKELLAKGPLTVDMSDYGGFEKVGSIGTRVSRTRYTAAYPPHGKAMWLRSTVWSSSPGGRSGSGPRP